MTIGIKLAFNDALSKSRGVHYSVKPPLRTQDLSLLLMKSGETLCFLFDA